MFTLLICAALLLMFFFEVELFFEVADFRDVADLREVADFRDGERAVSISSYSAIIVTLYTSKM